MDPSSLMQDPQMMAMAQQAMQDPEILNMMQQPGMMEKFQAAMSNPSLAMSDPDIMKLMMKFQGMGMGGGAGGMGGMGGMGGYGAPSGGSSAAGGSANIQHIKTPAQLTSLLKSAGDKLVVIDYFTTWCGPCKAIAPLFQELASSYSSKIVFVKVDGDQSRELCQQQGIQGFPTFQFYLREQQIESFSGADRNRLQRIVEEHANQEPPPPPCPYKHFPLREAELVKYADMKWEMVVPKFREFNAKFTTPDTSAVALSDDELSSLDKLIKTIQDKGQYHNTTVSSNEMEVIAKLLTWPKDCIGPVVNLLRMAVFHPSVAKYYVDDSTKKQKEGGSSTDLISTLLNLADAAEKHVTAMLIIRTIVNMFARRVLGKYLATNRYEIILERVAELYKKFSDENFRLSIIALYINFAIFFSEDPKYFEQAKVLLLTSVQDALQQSPIDAKMTYRLAVITGTLVYSDANATELARDLDVLSVLETAAKDEKCRDDQPTQQVKSELTKAITGK